MPVPAGSLAFTSLHATLAGAAITLQTVQPAVAPDSRPTELTITGTGFQADTQLTLVGGGVHELSRLPHFLPLGLAIPGDRLYIASFTLEVLDISDPAAPAAPWTVPLLRGEPGPET